jgi:hypothetical protein
MTAKLNLCHYPDDNEVCQTRSMVLQNLGAEIRAFARPEGYDLCRARRDWFEKVLGMYLQKNVKTHIIWCLVGNRDTLGQATTYTQGASTATDTRWHLHHLQPETSRGQLWMHWRHLADNEGNTRNFIVVYATTRSLSCRRKRS